MFHWYPALLHQLDVYTDIWDNKICNSMLASPNEIESNKEIVDRAMVLWNRQKVPAQPQSVNAILEVSRGGYSPL